MDSLQLSINRFLGELETILNYVQYIEDNFYMQYKDLCVYIETENIEKLVKGFNLYASESNEHKQNQSIIKQIYEEINVELKNYEQERKVYNIIKIPSWAESLEILKKEHGLLNYLDPCYVDGSYEEYINNLSAEELKNEIERFTPDGRKYYSRFSIEDYKKLIEYCKIEYNNYYVAKLNYNYDKLVNLKTLYNIFDDNNPINIYRQSFILLITAFDAIMYEISEEIYCNNFFKCIDKLVPKGKVSYTDIGKCKNFDEFKTNLVKEALDNIHLYKLLLTLYEFNEELFTIKDKNIFTDIIEMVKRRNIHVHNNGIVDKQYLEEKEKYNIYRLEYGDFAVINNEYFIHISEILKEFITHIN
ncbi:MAG: hypothetical protein Q8936_01615 [Bacillota bacterium]|nr:hypothetical protein [Bacillota bacterium]